jgi:ribosome-binding factor A
MTKSTSHRKEKLPELLKHLAAEFIERESNRTSLVTVTDATISDSQKQVRILFTVLPENDEDVVLEFLNRKKRDFFEFIDKRARIGRMPDIQFVVDKGEKNRQRIEFLSQNL